MKARAAHLVDRGSFDFGSEDVVERICEEWMKACSDDVCRCAIIGFSWREGRKAGYDDAVRKIKLATKAIKRAGR